MDSFIVGWGRTRFGKLDALDLGGGALTSAVSVLEPVKG